MRPKVRASLSGLRQSECEHGEMLDPIPGAEIASVLTAELGTSAERPLAAAKTNGHNQNAGRGVESNHNGNVHNDADPTQQPAFEGEVMPASSGPLTSGLVMESGLHRPNLAPKE